jgi:HK97 family phage major capsid protein
MIGLYCVTEDFAGHKAGEILKLSVEQAEKLADFVTEATEEDLSGQIGEDDKPETDQEPEQEQLAATAVTRAVDKLAKKIEDSVTRATEKAIGKPANVKIPAEAKDHKAGFKNMGDFARCLYMAKMGNYGAQRKLDGFVVKTSPTGMNETTSADGGYAVIPEWTSEIWDKVRSKMNLIQYVKKYSISGQTLNIPSVNETSRANGSRWGGVRSYYIAEGDTFTSSKLGLTQTSLTLNTLGAFVYVTNQLLQDNAFDLSNYIQDIVAQEMLFQTNDGLINGAGTTQPVGLKNAAALVTVAAEGSQSAATVLFPNLAKMWGRLYEQCYGSAIWIMNQQVYQQLVQMTFPNASGDFSVFGGVSFNAHDTFPLQIFGRPAVICENCSQLGNVGDIYLADLGEYAVIEKPFEMAISTDFHFNQNEVVYRFIYRWDAKSPWTSALTPYSGGPTTSPFIALASRGT